MSTWTEEEVKRIAGTDDLHISPFVTMELRMEHRHGSGRQSSRTNSMSVPTTELPHAGTKLR